MAYDSLRTEARSASSDRVSVSLPDLPEPPSITLGLLGRSLAFHVRKAQLVLQRRGLRSVAGVNIGPAEYGTLVLCEQNPGLAQFQIASTLDVDKASVVAVVDRLEELGWLLRRRSNHDRRRYGLCLTPEGLRQVQALRRQAEEAEAFARDIFSAEELDQLLSLLARLG
ncbi:MAG TPA: MarR family winged helix-turn-helix transcriptional regulator [Steroidobacteraceae bacterium]|nr:MarR family winged helix-turn-helix transcriptional regulator [Steroidobacteraceae bacterium]